MCVCRRKKFFFQMQKNFKDKFLISKPDFDSRIRILVPQINMNGGFHEVFMINATEIQYLKFSLLRKWYQK